MVFLVEIHIQNLEKELVDTRIFAVGFYGILNKRYAKVLFRKQKLYNSSDTISTSPASFLNITPSLMVVPNVLSFEHEDSQYSFQKQ